MFEQTHNSDQAITLVDAPQASAPMLAVTATALDSPKEWLVSQAFEPPLSPEAIAQVQLEIDGIIGTTRENKSIAKLVWNGDVRYWKEFHDKWDAEGEPIGDTYKRPQVLYKNVFSSDDVWQFDAFPPRFLILTRIEPEQYAATWERESQIYHPDFHKNVQLLPSECPPERHIWFMTIAQHVAGCCQRAAAEDHNCYGRYAHPRAALDELRRVRTCMEAEGSWGSRPFDSPADIKTRLEREGGNHDYIADALQRFRAQRERAIDESPLATASPGQFMKTPDLVALRKELIESGKRDEEKLEKDLKKRSLR